MGVYICPVCSGKGLVMSDFYEHKDPYGFASTAMPTLTQTCRSCGGRGIVFDTHGDTETFAQHYDCLPIPHDDFFGTDQTVYVPSACRSCPNHSSNGGSGVCHCILGVGEVR